MEHQHVYRARPFGVEYIKNKVRDQQYKVSHDAGLGLLRIMRLARGMEPNLSSFLFEPDIFISNVYRESFERDLPAIIEFTGPLISSFPLLTEEDKADIKSEHLVYLIVKILFVKEPYVVSCTTSSR